MKKKIDFKKSVYELTKEYPELLDIMVGLGFKEIKNKMALNSVGKVMTIPKGAVIKNISMMKIVKALMDNGFEIVGEMPPITINLDKKDEGISKKEELKSYLKRLKDGEDIESLKEDFCKNFAEVDPSLIMEAEQDLIKEGTPISEMENLCDIHSALFHGRTTEEKINNAEAAVRESMMKKTADRKTLSLNLSKIKGHPIYTFVKENEALSNLIEDFKENKDEKTFEKIREVSVHYAKKGDLLYPNLKVKYGISGPSDVMWSVDDDIRRDLGILDGIEEHDDKWNHRLDVVLKRIEEMIYKENNILFPVCTQFFTNEDWIGIYKDSKDYKVCFDVKNETWDDAENQMSDSKMSYDGEIVMPGGHMTVEEMTAMLNTIPLEITFVDKEDKNRYFNEGEKLFKRPQMAIDRSVYSCHPPKIEPMVRSIIESFKSGERDYVEVWMEKENRTMLVKYMAVRDRDKNYLGTMEIVQDMEFVKKHFNI